MCAAAGAQRPPCGSVVTDAIREAIRSDPFIQLKLTADLDLARSHYLDIYSECHAALPEDFFSRRADYANRAKDLEVLCRLDIRPNTVHPAIDVLRLAVPQGREPQRNMLPGLRAVSGLACVRVRSDRLLQTDSREGRGEMLLPGRMLGPRRGPIRLRALLTSAYKNKEEVRKAKAESCKAIEQADRLFIRPHHLMCLMCHYGLGDLENPLDVDNLHEILVKMRDNPDIPVTLNEGCCMVCDPCPAYDPDKHMCIWIYTRDQLKDLRVLQKLGLKPGDTVGARELMNLLTARIKTTTEICGADVFVRESYVWAPCSSAESGNYERARSVGLFDS